MASILGILVILSYLASIVFLIIVLIKLFQTKGALHGILGILCGIYTFIWGWINARPLGLRNIMIYWTIALLVGIVSQVFLVASVQGTPTTTPLGY